MGFTQVFDEAIRQLDIVINKITMIASRLHAAMIRTFKHKGLERFFRKSDHRGIIAKTEERTERMLDRLDAVVRPEDMNIPGYKFHPLSGDRKGAYAVTVTGNWRITFKFDGIDAIDVNLEDYH